jgi:hypothetical protein
MYVVGPLKLYILSKSLFIHFYLFICGLFNNCVITSEYVCTKMDEHYVNNDLERIWKKAALA